MHVVAILILALLSACAVHPNVGTGVDSVAAARIGALVPHRGGEASSLADRMRYYGVPGVSVAVLRGGEIAWARGFGVRGVTDGAQIDAETVFSVGSVSKVAAAATTLRLVDAGRLALDRDVNEYLRSWKVPDHRWSAARGVTLRRLLSHTAGTTVHGFADFQPGESLPTTVEILEGRRPAKNAPVVVDLEPVTRQRYSGGGTMVQQLVIEDTTALSFAEAARAWVFEPLAMRRSTFANPIPATRGNVARAHGRYGHPAALPRGWEAMPEAAASGLWTSPSDYAQLLIALRDAWLGVPEGFLSRPLAREVMTKVAPSDYGLGPGLAGQGRSARFRHNGSNASYKAAFVVYLESGDGAIAFTNGSRGARLIDEIFASLARTEGWPADEAP